MNFAHVRGSIWLSWLCICLSAGGSWIPLAGAQISQGSSIADVQQISIPDRPFGIDRTTLIQHTDGFFDTTIGDQLIGVFLRNDGAVVIRNVHATASFPPGSGIVVTQTEAAFGDLAPGVPALRLFRADFSAAAPGKYLLSLLAVGDGFTQTTSRNVFVTRSVHDPLDVNRWTMHSDIGRITTDVLGSYTDATGDVNLGTIGVLQAFKWTVEYDAPFSGQIGPLPYGDPWWKAFGLGFAIGGCIVWVAGAIERRCGNEKDGDLVINIGQAEKAIGGIVAAFDSKDPIRRGQENTLPLPGERTVREEVVLSAAFSGAPRLGTAWSALVSWTYTRFTDQGNSYTFSVNETQSNQHYTTSRNLAINKQQFVVGDVIRVTASATGPKALTNDRAYFVANVFNPADPRSTSLRAILLRDDGKDDDPVAGDGTYTGTTSTQGLPIGMPLALAVLGFDVNNAAATDPPLVAAQEIGGVLVSAPGFSRCDIVPDFKFSIGPSVPAITGSGLVVLMILLLGAGAFLLYMWPSFRGRVSET